MPRSVGPWFLMWQYPLFLGLILAGFLASARYPRGTNALLAYTPFLSFAVTMLLVLTGLHRLLTRDTWAVAHGVHYFLAHVLVVLVGVGAPVCVGSVVQRSIASRRYLGIFVGAIPLLSFLLVLFGAFTGYLLSGYDDPPAPSILRFHVLHGGLAPIGILLLLFSWWRWLHRPGRSPAASRDG